MTQRYVPNDIEPKWQAKWAEDKIYEVAEDSSKPKIYASPMLPYPSGTGLHTGHVRNYSITDAVARYHRQRGYNTMSNIAWDAFGLPAENFAIKTGTPPAVSTAQNIAYFKKQLQRLGMSYDWSREFDTSDPSYYKWTQWVFSLMYKRGLAYKAEKQQWWCDKCNTVLADEQVTASGKCWRHEGPEDAEVTKKSVNQWFFKITDYADEILESTDALNWPEKIKTMQKNWIGKSEGALIRFDVANLRPGTEDRGPKSDDFVQVYTTRPDTLFGVTFVVLAPEHPLVNKLIDQCDNPQDVEAYIEKSRRKSDLERETEKVKTGVALEGITVVNPINGKEVPLWVADYVLTSYGTGAVMGVPAHDERDNEFAKKYGLEIVQVTRPLLQVPDTKDTEFSFRGDAIVAIVHDKKRDRILSIKWLPDENDMSGKWTGNFLVGGGVEDGESIEETALREVREETGYTDLKVIGASSFEVANHYYSVLKKQWRKAHIRAVHIELLSDERSEPTPEDYESGAYEVEWLATDLARKAIHDTAHAYFLSDYLQPTLFSGYGELMNSGKYDGLQSLEAKRAIVEDLRKTEVAKPETQYKIRDWLISRQRYWGAPVPIVYCEEHGEVLVPEDQLPVMLPEVKNYVPDGKNSSVLAGVEEFVNTTCPECGKPAKRETDVMDGYVCSTWYLHRYTDAHNDSQAFDTSKSNYWFPIDFYFGGDHAVAHLLYIRFFQKVLCDAGLATEREPIKQLVYNGYINAEDGRKMSKSLGNTVDPMDIIESGYGADALRVFELFIAPYDQDTSWNANGVPGTYRFLNRVWTLVQEYLEQSQATSHESRDESQQILSAAHKMIKKVTDDLESLSFNTAVAAMMSAVNELFLIKAKDGYASVQAWQFALESLAQCLGPFAPHIAEELWHQLGHEDSVHSSHWPEHDEKYLVSDTVTYAVQVNGKVRGEIQMPSDASEADVVAAARASEKVAGYVTTEPKKTIFVQNRLVSFVV